MERKIVIGMGIVLIALILYNHNATLRVSRQDIEALSDQQRALLDKTRSVQQKKENAQRAITALRSSIQELQNHVATLNRELQAIQEEAKALQQGLDHSDKALSQMKRTPQWNLYSMDMALVALIILSICWLLYRWYVEHRRLAVAAKDQKVELKVLEGRKADPDAASAGMGQRKKT